MCGGIVLGIKECGVAVVGRSVEEHLVDARDESRDIVARAHGVRAQGCLQAGHREGGGDAFAGDVAEGNAKLAIRQSEKIVVVPANTKSGAAAAEVVEAGNPGQSLREEALLYFARNLDLAVQLFAAANFHCDS